MAALITMYTITANDAVRQCGQASSIAALSSTVIQQQGLHSIVTKATWNQCFIYIYTAALTGDYYSIDYNCYKNLDVASILTHAGTMSKKHLCSIWDCTVLLMISFYRTTLLRNNRGIPVLNHSKITSSLVWVLLLPNCKSNHQNWKNITLNGWTEFTCVQSEELQMKCPLWNYSF